MSSPGFLESFGDSETNQPLRKRPRIISDAELELINITEDGDLSKTPANATFDLQQPQTLTVPVVELETLQSSIALPTSYTRSLLKYKNVSEDNSQNETMRLVPAVVSDSPHDVTPLSVEPTNVVIELLGDVDLESSEAGDVQYVLIQAENPDQIFSNPETLTVTNDETDLNDLEQNESLQDDSCSCDICDKILVGPFYKFRHLRCEKKSDNVLWCPYCSFGAELKGDLNHHMAADHGLDPDGRRLKDIQCPDPECRFSCSTTSQMAAHTFELHPYRHKCDQCPASFYSKVNLAYHRATAHCTEDVFSCNTCEFKTTFKYKLKSHLQTHVDKVTCTICGALVTSASMKVHQSTHSVSPTISIEVEFNCHMCSFKTKVPYSIKFHLRTVHSLTFEEITKIVEKWEV